MTLSPVDWIIVVVYLAGCVIAGVWMKRFVRGVEDFAVAGREMDVNLGVASLAATEVGIVTIMYTAQMGFTNGPAGATPGVVTALAMFLVGLTGFVIVPMRNAGVMTIPELFEKRFGKFVRWLAGVVVILGGVLNMGIFLRLGGQFLVHVTGLPEQYLEWTMTALLVLVLVYTVLGGMLSVLITDYLQFIVMGLGIVVTSVLVLWGVSWGGFVERLQEADSISGVVRDCRAEAGKAELALTQAQVMVAVRPNIDPPATAAGEVVKTAEQARISHALAGKATTQVLVARARGEDVPLAQAYAESAADVAAQRAQHALVARGLALEEAQASLEGVKKAGAKLKAAIGKARQAAGLPDKGEDAPVNAAEEARVAQLEAVLAGEVARHAEQQTANASGASNALAQLPQFAAEKARQARAKAEATQAAAEEVERSAVDAAAALVAARAAADNLEKASGGLSIGNPFNPVGSGGLGWGWVIWQAMTAIAVVTTWQTTIARVLSARDAATAKKVYRRTAFYFVGRFCLPGLWGAAAFLYFWGHGGLPSGLDSLSAMPAFLQVVLPTGLIGLMIAAMLAAEMSTDSGYLLTWATVIYNDIISPCLRRPLSAKAKLLTVRAMVLAIGLFLIFYGLWYELPGGAWDYLAVTGNIYLASLFTLLVGALYWRGANSWGAVAAIVLGAAGPLTFLVVNAVVPADSPWRIAPEVAGLAAFLCSLAGMFFGSMAYRMAHNMQTNSAPDIEEAAS